MSATILDFPTRPAPPVPDTFVFHFGDASTIRRAHRDLRDGFDDLLASIEEMSAERDFLALRRQLALAV